MLNKVKKGSGEDGCLKWWVCHTKGMALKSTFRQGCLSKRRLQNRSVYIPCDKTALSFLACALMSSDRSAHPTRMCGTCSDKVENRWRPPTEVSQTNSIYCKLDVCYKRGSRYGVPKRIEFCLCTRHRWQIVGSRPGIWIDVSLCWAKYKKRSYIDVFGTHLHSHAMHT